MNNEGFSLIEIMIASSILSLVFIGFMTSFVQATRLQYMASRHYSASVIARNRIEETKIYAFETVPALAEINTRVNDEGVYCPTGWYWRSTILTNSMNNSNCLQAICRVMYWTKPGITADAPVEITTLIGG